MLFSKSHTTSSLQQMHNIHHGMVVYKYRRALLSLLEDCISNIISAHSLSSGHATLELDLSRRSFCSSQKVASRRKLNCMFGKGSALHRSLVYWGLFPTDSLAEVPVWVCRDISHAVLTEHRDRKRPYGSGLSKDF